MRVCACLRACVRARDKNAFFLYRLELRVVAVVSTSVRIVAMIVRLVKRKALPMSQSLPFGIFSALLHNPLAVFRN